MNITNPARILWGRIKGTLSDQVDLIAKFATYALLSGAQFTGAISATNLSGTNTGDQDLSPYAKLSGATFTGNISAVDVTFSGTLAGNVLGGGFKLIDSGLTIAISGVLNITDKYGRGMFLFDSVSGGGPTFAAIPTTLATGRLFSNVSGDTVNVVNVLTNGVSNALVYNVYRLGG